MRKLNINIGNLLMLTSVIVMSVYTYTVRRRNNELVKLYNKKVEEVKLHNSIVTTFKSFVSKVDTLQVNLEKHRTECPHYKNKLK